MKLIKSCYLYTGMLCTVSGLPTDAGEESTLEQGVDVPGCGSESLSQLPGTIIVSLC